MRWSPLLTIALVGLLAIACTSTPQGAVDEPAATGIDSPGDSTDDPAPDPAAEPAVDDDELDTVWTRFVTAWLDQATVADPDPAAFEDLAADPDGVVETLIAQRGDSRLVTTDRELWSRSDILNGTAEVADCTIVEQHPDGHPDSLASVTISWEATAVRTDDGWRIVDARQLDLFCIAEELNAQLLDAYRAFREAKDAAWDPPDPDHPDLERTMTGEQLEFIRDLLAEHQREGIVVRDPAPTDNAVVFEVGIGTATVSDCAEQVSERGAFDLATGNRLDVLIPPIRDGQLDLQSVELERGDDGNWRVLDQAGTRDTNCEPGGTRYVVS